MVKNFKRVLFVPLFLFSFFIQASGHGSENEMKKKIPQLNKDLEKSNLSLKSAASFQLGKYAKKNVEIQNILRESGTLSLLVKALVNPWSDQTLKLDAIVALCRATEGNADSLTKIYTKRKVRIFSNLLKEKDYLIQRYAARMLYTLARNGGGEDYFSEVNPVPNLVDLLRTPSFPGKNSLSYTLYFLLENRPELKDQFEKVDFISLMRVIQNIDIVKELKSIALQVLEKNLVKDKDQIKKISTKRKKKIFEKLAQSFDSKTQFYAKRILALLKKHESH